MKTFSLLLATLLLGAGTAPTLAQQRVTAVQTRTAPVPDENTLTYYIPPQILPDGSLRLRGGFDFRPNAVRFDMVFVNIGGGWQLSALSVVETDVNAPR